MPNLFLIATTHVLAHAERRVIISVLPHAVMVVLVHVIYAAKETVEQLVLVANFLV